MHYQESHEQLEMMAILYPKPTWLKEICHEAWPRTRSHIWKVQATTTCSIVFWWQLGFISNFNPSDNSRFVHMETWSQPQDFMDHSSVRTSWEGGLQIWLTRWDTSPSCVPCFSTEETTRAKGPRYAETATDKQCRGSGFGATMHNWFPLA